MRTYRYPAWVRATHLIMGSLMVLIGVSIAIEPSNADHSGTSAGSIAIGSAFAAVFILIAIDQVTSRLIIGEHGLTWRSVIGSRKVPWADIQDVLIVKTFGVGTRFYRPAIVSGGRLIRIPGVAGSHSYIESIAAAIRDAQLRASAAASIAEQERVVPPVT